MKTTDENLKQNIFIILWCILLAFLMLMICSRSSFLYPCNDWNDANSFLTMGKAMMKGQVLYRDLYEQKGPYLYLFYGLASLISRDSFFGVFLLEIASLAISLFALYKIMTLYCRKKTAAILLPFLTCAIVVSKSFYWGGSAEEFCLPFMSISLYMNLYYFKRLYPNKKPALGMLLINGIFAGVIAQIKYTLLGFYFIWIVMIAFANLAKKEYKESIRICITFLLGMLLSAIPWFIYFVTQSALDDWYQCYIYDNIFLYGSLAESRNIKTVIYDLAKIIYYLILDNISYFLFIIIGMIFVLIHSGFRWYEKLNLYAIFGMLFLGIYIGGANLPYYSLPLTIFAVLGFTAIGCLLDSLFHREYRTKASLILAGTAVIVSMSGAYKGSMNTFFIGHKQEDFFLFHFKDIVEQEEYPTLLSYNCLDPGLYTVADIMPTCRFYHRCNMPLDEMLQEMDRYITECRVQFVITKDSYPEILLDNYELVARETYEQTGTTYCFEYYLFKLKY